MSDERDDLEPERDDDELEDDEVDHGGRTGASFLAGLALGALLGVGAALLLAPERGEVTRRRIRHRLRDMRDDASERIDDVRDATERQLRRQRRRLRQHLPHR